MMRFRRIVSIVIVGLLIVLSVGSIGVYKWYTYHKHKALTSVEDFWKRLTINTQGDPKIRFCFREVGWVSYTPMRFEITYENVRFEVDAIKHDVIVCDPLGGPAQQDFDFLTKFDFSKAKNEQERLKLAERYLQIIGKPEDAVFEKSKECLPAGSLDFKWIRTFKGYKYRNFPTGAGGWTNKIHLSVKDNGTINFYKKVYWAIPPDSAEVRVTEDEANKTAVKAITRLVPRRERRNYVTKPLSAELFIVNPNRLFDKGTIWCRKIERFLSGISYSIYKYGLLKTIDPKSRLAWVVVVQHMPIGTEPVMDYHFIIVHVDAANGKVLGGSSGG